MFKRKEHTNNRPPEENTTAPVFTRAVTVGDSEADCRGRIHPGALLRPWYNKRVLDLSCVREHDDLLFSPTLTEELVRGFGFLLPYYDYLEAVTRREDA